MRGTEGKKALSAFPGLLVIGGDKPDFIQVFYAFRIQQLCRYGSSAAGFYLLQPS